MSRKRVLYKVGGAVTRTEKTIADPGVLVLDSWPGLNRITTCEITQEH